MDVAQVKALAAAVGLPLTEEQAERAAVALTGALANLERAAEAVPATVMAQLEVPGDFRPPGEGEPG